MIRNQLSGVSHYRDRKSLGIFILLFSFVGTNIYAEDSYVQDKRLTLEAVNITMLDQQKNISGLIVDKTGEPVIGANVVIKGQTTIGTITDIDGRFTLNVPEGAVLVVSYIGYKSQEVPVTGSVLNILMEDDATTMDEVVVVGYGIQKKVNLTGSLSTVTSKDIVGRTNPNLLQSLQGTAPGVTIISRPGKTPSINVRGRGNLGTSAPLYVIDGAISSAETFANLDPNAIETVSILKDAASAAIYGSRAAYGVVLVTTKQGGQEGFKVDYSGLVGFKRQTSKPQVVSSEWEAILTNEAYENAGKTAPISEEAIELMRNGSQPDLYPNTDWWDLVFNDNVINTSHTLSLSGSSGKTSYFTSIGYAYDDAFRIGESTDRYNVNANLSSQLKPWLKIRTNIKYTEFNMDRTTGNFPIEHVTQLSPGFVARQSNGEWGTVHNGGWASKNFVTRNPLRIAEEGGWKKEDHKFLTLDGAIDINLYKGLVLTGQITSDMRDKKQKTYDGFLPVVPQFAIPGFPEPGYEGGKDQKESKMEYNWEDYRRMTYNAFLNYDWSNNIHNIKALVAMSYEHYEYQQQKSSRKDFPTNGMNGMNGGSTAPGMVAAEGPLHEEKLLSYFGRVNYDYLGKYLAEINFRRDGSSRFHKDERWGFFPSFSAGWRMSEELFMKEIPWLDT